jgi:predicted dithiol-disulfide oxidoreductase (DUF899 family)
MTQEYVLPLDDRQATLETVGGEPLWNLFDLTPEGRPTDWDENVVHDRFPQLSYRKESER